MARRIINRKPVTVIVHPCLFDKMEELRKMYQQQAGMKLSQLQATGILSQSIKLPNKINILEEKNVKKKKG